MRGHCQQGITWLFLLPVCVDKSTLLLSKTLQINYETLMCSEADIAVHIVKSVYIKGDFSSVDFRYFAFYPDLVADWCSGGMKNVHVDADAGIAFF